MEAEADQEWQPPSEAQLKIDKARRERSDKISKIMGDYLLKGYRMLGIVCDDCGTILLQDKQGQTYCIACKELDSDADKDDPVTNATAALSKVGESKPFVSPVNPNRGPWRSFSGGDVCQPLHKAMLHEPGVLPSANSSSLSQDPVAGVSVAEACESLELKLMWASRELCQSASVEYCTQLCQLIKASAEAIVSLRRIV